MNGAAATIWSIALLTFLGVAVVVGGAYARRHGHLQSKGSKLAAFAIVLILALIVWVGPGLFIVAD